MRLKTIDTRGELRAATTGMLLLISGQIGDKQAAQFFFDFGVATFAMMDCGEILSDPELSPELRRATKRILGVAARRAGQCCDALDGAMDSAMQAAAAEFAASTEPASVN